MMTAQKLFHNFPCEVVTFVSGKPFDFSLPACPPFITPEQKDCLRGSLNEPFRGIVNIRQVHGNHILAVDGQAGLNENEIVEADGIVTNIPGIALVIRTADCLPIFIYDERRRVLALIHAGWRGSKSEIALKALESMQQKWGTMAQDCIVSLGPAIGACCYEVGQEFSRRFPLETESREGRWFLNLPLLNRNQMINYGVNPEKIFDCGICTCCHQEYFSYRRDGAQAGRNLSLLMLKG